MKNDKKFATGSIRVKALDKENGTFEFVASGVKEDRYGEKVMTKGWIFKHFKKNPVMLWGHDHKIPAIANVTKIWKDDKQVYAKATWASTKFAQEIRTLVEEGFLHAVSVGFRVLEHEGEWPNYIYTKQELLEISIVNVPAYAEALITEAKSMGLKEVVKTIESTCPTMQAQKEINSLHKQVDELNEKLNAMTKKKVNAKSVEKSDKVETSKKVAKDKQIDYLRIADKAIEQVLRELKSNK